MTFFVSYKDLMQAEMPRMKRAAAVIVLIFTYAFGIWSGILFPNAFSIFSISMASAAVSALLFMFRSPYVYIAPVLTFPTVLLLTHSLQSAMFSVSYVPLSVVLAIALYKKYSKSQAVFVSSFAFGVTVAILYGISRLCGQDLLPTAAEFRGDIELFFSSIAMNTQNGRVPLFTSDAARGVADYVMLSLPALFITAVNAVSYFSASILSVLCRIFFFSEHIPDGKWDYMPEAAAAIIFIISYFVSSALVPYAEADVIGFAAENMLLALTPAMVIAGEKAAFGFALKHEKRILFVFLTIFVIALSISLYLMIISFLGAIHVIYKPIRPLIARLFHKKDDDDDDFYDDY